jgi:hypothetical protein
MSILNLFRKRAPHNYLAEDHARRAIASGEYSPQHIETLLTLARSRNKQHDIIHIYRQLQRMGDATAINQKELDYALKADAQKCAYWQTKGDKQLCIGVLYHQDWLRPLSAGIVKQAAGYGHVFETNSEKELIRAKPDAVLSTLISRRAMLKLRRALPDTFWVYLRHGFANKRSSFPLAGAFDAVCVSSPYVSNMYTDRGLFPPRDVWVTGYPALDPLAMQQHQTSQQPRTILYAPTVNSSLSSASMGPMLLQHMLNSAIDIRVIVKLHPGTFQTDPAIWQSWQNACAKEERAQFVDDQAANLLDLFEKTDLMISDFSSTAFSFLATDRPIVLITQHGAMADHGSFNPDGIEWKWRDMAEEVRDISALTPVLRKILAGRDDYATARAKYRKLLFDGTLDGNSSARVMQRLGQVFGRATA